MIAARNLLKAGLRKSIGTGATTAVWSDAWIPVTPPTQLVGKNVFKDPYLLVYHLIDQHTKVWKDEVLHQLFTAEEVKRIRCVKPSRTPQMDKFVWAYTKSGIYTVKTGYNLASDLKETSDSPQVLEPSVTALKSRVWTTKTTRKIKHFMWQSIAGCLPVKNNLVERHFGIDRLCPRCDAAPETPNHLLFECPAALQVRSISEFPYVLGDFPCDSLYKNVDHLFWRAKEANIPEKTIERFPWIMWYLWKARNEKVFNEKDIPHLDTFQLACAESENWTVAQLVDNPLENDVTPSSVAPTEQIITFPRCQSDASWCPNSSFFGKGFVIENENGERIWGASAEFQVSSPLHAELTALTWAMTMALQRGLYSLSFETDCMQLVKIIEDEEEWPTMASELEVFKFLRSSFSIFSLSFIPCLLNVRADSLSKGARARDCCFSYVDHSIPSWLVLETNQLN
ncbi:unnamed protein product [Microthlaspi erraticum]|uniref:RNase H type-1 domain-containing protein n=1 Tax=Microthlaspi erraticum TaxID=1685480 RepID=A0A6D2HW40_9BRAS|nr:unnamed protein product [Microthlaspi erraticum]